MRTVTAYQLGGLFPHEGHVAGSLVLQTRPWRRGKTLAGEELEGGWNFGEGGGG